MTFLGYIKVRGAKQMLYFKPFFLMWLINAHIRFLGDYIIIRNGTTKHKVYISEFTEVKMVARLKLSSYITILLPMVLPLL